MSPTLQTIKVALKNDQQKNNFIIKVCYHFYRFILSRRYATEIKGIELFESGKGKLILPNHQSHMDPQIMSIELYNHGGVVPVVTERFYKIPVIRYFLKKWNAVSVSDLNGGNRDPKILETISTKVSAALSEGKNVIIFPSGKLAESGLEAITNKQSAYTIVKNLPDNTQVIGVRVSGLWGSMWSKAWNGKQPNFFKTFIKGIGLLLANLIFLAPRRKVQIEFIDITDQAKLQAQTDRKTFNTFLENFYNVRGNEKPHFVRHFFFLPRLRKI